MPSDWRPAPAPADAGHEYAVEDYILAPASEKLHLRVWWERWAGVDAVRVTGRLVNAFGTPHVPPAQRNVFLDALTVEVAGAHVGIDAASQVFDPRRPWIFRRVVGPDAGTVRRCEHIERAPVAQWLRGKARIGRINTEFDALHLGIWTLAMPEVRGSGSLNGSHGGRRLAPWDGGAEGWQTLCHEGLAWMTEEWPMQAMRCPVYLLTEEGRWYNPRAPYWPGATVAHEPPGYDIVQTFAGGDWEWPGTAHDYLGQLRQYRAHDHTHYRRAFGAAAAVALYDLPAREFLCQLAGNVIAWLDGSGSPEGSLSALWNYQSMLVHAGEHEGSSFAGRGMAHAIGCLLEAAPYLGPEFQASFDARPWPPLMAEFVRHVTAPNGWAHRAQKTDFPTPSGGWGSLVDPICAPREVDLLGATFIPLGLHTHHENWRASMAPIRTRKGWKSAPEHMEFRADAEHWAEVAGRNYNAQPEYDLFRRDFSRYGSVTSVVVASQSSSPNELLLANLSTSAWAGHVLEGNAPPF